MTDVVGNPEEERRADFFHLPWSQEAVCRYFYGKVLPLVRNCYGLKEKFSILFRKFFKKLPFPGISGKFLVCDVDG